MMLLASKRIDKHPTPRKRFSDKFPTAGTDKMTNTRQMPQLQQSYKIHKRDCFHPQMTLKPFHFHRLSFVMLFCHEYFLNKRIKSRMAFQQLAGVALPCEQRLHFRCVSWRAKSFARQVTQRKCSLCSQGRVAFAITRFITFQ